MHKNTCLREIRIVDWSPLACSLKMVTFEPFKKDVFTGHDIMLMEHIKEIMWKLCHYSQRDERH